MADTLIFSNTSNQIFPGTAGFDQLSVGLPGSLAQSQLVLKPINASTFRLEVFSTNDNFYIPLYEIRRDPFNAAIFQLTQIFSSATPPTETLPSATLNQIDQISFGVPGSGEMLTVNLLPVILTSEADGGEEDITEIQGTPFNDRPVITLSGITKPTDLDKSSGSLVLKEGNVTVLELVKNQGPMNSSGPTQGGAILKVYNAAGTVVVHEYHLDAAVDSVQLVFSDGAAVLNGLVSNPSLDPVPLPLVRAVVASPDPIKVANFPNPLDQDEINFRVDLNEPIDLQKVGQGGSYFDTLKFALKIGGRVVYADIQGTNGNDSGANQIWFSYTLQETDTGAVSMLGLVEYDGTNALPFTRYTIQTEYTGIGNFGNQAFSYIYPKIEFANDPITDLKEGGNKFIGLFDPTEINLVADAKVELTGNRNTLGIAIDGTGGAVLSASEVGGVYSVFTNVGTTPPTLVAKFAKSTDANKYLFWTGSDANSSDPTKATTISTADFQQLVLVLRVEGTDSNYIAKVGEVGNVTYWTFAEQRPLLFSLVSRDFAEPERPDVIAKTGDAFANTLDVSGQAVTKNFDLFGFQGNDNITGHDGIDRISGGAGNDTIDAGKGNDVLILGDMSDGAGDDVVNLGDGTDAIAFSGFDNPYAFEAITIKTGGGAEQLEIRDPDLLTGDAVVVRVEKAANFVTNSQVLVTTYEADGSVLNTSLVSNAESLVNIGNSSQQFLLKGRWSSSEYGNITYQGSIFGDVIDPSSVKLVDDSNIRGGLGDDTLVLQTANNLTGGQWNKYIDSNFNYTENWIYTVLGSGGEAPTSETKFRLSRTFANNNSYESWSIVDQTGLNGKTVGGLSISDVETIEIKNGGNVLRTISLVDFLAPDYQSASLRGNQLTLVFDEALDAVNKPAADRFTLFINDQAQNVLIPGVELVEITNTQVLGNKLTLTLSQSVTNLTQQVTIAYNDPNPGMDEASDLQDIYGNVVASFSDPQPVQVIFSNNIQAQLAQLKAKSSFIGEFGKDILDMSKADVGQDVNLFYTKSDQPTGFKHTIRGIEDLKGSTYGDNFKGNGWANTLDGDVGNDVLDGGLGDDVLLGGLGDDQLLGGFGRDTLYGGVGSDVLTGGIGSDKFVLSVSDAVAGGVDRITDFNFIADVIQLHAMPGTDLTNLTNLFSASTNTLLQLGTAAPIGTNPSVYYDNTGKLYFDAGGAANPVLLAQLDALSGGGFPQLLAANIKLVDSLPTLIV